MGRYNRSVSFDETRPDDFKVIQIKFARAGFPAARAGLRVGDTIVAIDGRPAAEYDLDMLGGMFKRAGTKYVRSRL